MKSKTALNKTAPYSPLNMKLREIHAIKQATNNSHMSEEAKRIIMSACDSQRNQAWRWHYKGRPGYEIVKRDPRSVITRVLVDKYHLRVDTTSPTHMYGTNQIINLMVVSPHEGTKNRWMLRIAPMATFDRWANSTAIEQFFNSPEDVAFYLYGVRTVYQKLFESLSREVEEERGNL
jgi:hypothetical protein